MVEFVGWLNDNAGVLTSAFVVLTSLTLIETREARIAGSGTAHIAFRPDIDRSAGTTLRLGLRNHGPAVGEDVQMRMQWIGDGKSRSAVREMIEPVLGIGDERVYVPDMLLTDRVRSSDSVFSTYGNYPLSIFGAVLGWLFTFVVPLAFVAYLPATVLLDRTAELQINPVFAYAAPLAGVIWLAIATRVFARSGGQLSERSH